nr:hypothetical protein [uncultured Cellulosilyticum sp.]
MEHVKIRNKQAQEESNSYEMPLVNYNKEELSIRHEEDERRYNEAHSNNDEIDVSPYLEASLEDKAQGILSEADKLDTTSESKQRRQVSYIWIEAFFCAIILLGILIIQNVKNTEELQLKLRQEIRHDLTAEELVEVGENLESMMQKYKNVTP